MSGGATTENTTGVLPVLEAQAKLVMFVPPPETQSDQARLSPPCVAVRVGFVVGWPSQRGPVSEDVSDV